MKKVEDFYPITKIKYPDGNGEISLITDDDIKKHTPANELNFLRGHLSRKARVAEGVNPADVERWLNRTVIEVKEG